MTRNSLERRKVFFGRLASLSVIAFVVALALLSAACNNVNLTGEGGGTVSLAIDEVLASEIRSAIPAPLRSTTGDNSTYTLTASIRGDYSEEKTEFATEASLSGVTFTFKGIPTGKDIILDVTVKVGDNTIWYGNSGKHMVVSGINKLNVAVGRVSGVLLWNNDSVKIAPYGKHEEAGTKVLDVPDVLPSWCFDHLRNLYVITSTGVSMYDSQGDGTYYSTPSNFIGSDFSYLSYDSDSRTTLYGMSTSQISKLIANSPSEPIINSLSNHGINTPVGFAVHGGSAYVADQSSEDDNGIPSITISSFNLTTQDFTLGIAFKLPTVFGSQPTYQMIYQEGALYLLLSCVKDSAPNIYSVGAVAKIDAKTLTLDTSFGTNGYLGLVSTKREVSYKDSSGQDQSYSVYAAGNSTEEVFSKPLGFVAIMPKKLVIADAGCIVSEEIVDQGGVSKLKGDAVSRIVTVDLETQSLGFDDLNPNQYYWTGNPLGSSVEISSDTSSDTSSSSF
ncbi:MAG: hypothetical protein J6K76_06680 [Spirochaetaceae bacterium]|nr:hypothetical protein [Spirochaetaceae bacterium]